MKAYYRFSTHDDPSQNYWYILGEKDAPEKEGEAISPWNGEEAYLRTPNTFPPYCVITLQPVSDAKYFLIIESPDGTECIMTYRQYSWEEVVGHAALFKGQSFKAAQRILKSKKL